MGMLKVTLPDGSVREYTAPLTVMAVAEDIGSGLARATVAGRVEGVLVDTTYVIEKDSVLQIITQNTTDGLEIIRHSCAHLMAHAVKNLFPETQVTIGPVIEDGFYYDFYIDHAFTDEDFLKIEGEMKRISKLNHPILRSVKSKKAAIDFFNGIGETFKGEIVNDLPDDIEISLYTQGDFVDLCRGPHVPSTGVLKYFKLMKTSGAYWRGDSNNPVLQRIYGTAWADKQSLKDYLYRIEEAKKRDHRKLGKALDLFHFQDISPGIAFWHPKGNQIWRVVEDYMRASNEKYGSQEIRTPLIADITLWEKSGHQEKYSEHMFMTHSERRDYALRPMNCPTCVQIFNAYPRSYKELPIRLSEFGLVHRNEASGALHGLMRVRSFTQDDGHIFCTEDQVESEVIQMIDQCYEVYRDFGFNEFEIKVALRPEARIGSDEVWDKSEKLLSAALDAREIEYELLLGEGAFYGPKIEFHLKDAIGRKWQCGTIQMDFSMPERLGAQIIDHHSQKITPIMLHRAIVGSLERFIGILIENHAGILPVWLAPTKQVRYLHDFQLKFQ